MLLYRAGLKQPVFHGAEKSEKSLFQASAEVRLFRSPKNVRKGSSGRATFPLPENLIFKAAAISRIFRCPKKRSFNPPRRSDFSALLKIDF